MLALFFQKWIIAFCLCYLHVLCVPLISARAFRVIYLYMGPMINSYFESYKVRWDGGKDAKHLELTATIKLKLLSNNRHDYQGPFLKKTNVKMKLFIVLAGPFDSRHCYQTCNRKWPWNISCGFWTKKTSDVQKFQPFLTILIDDNLYIMRYFTKRCWIFPSGFSAILFSTVYNNWKVSTEAVGLLQRRI